MCRPIYRKGQVKNSYKICNKRRSSHGHVISQKGDVTYFSVQDIKSTVISVSITNPKLSRQAKIFAKIVCLKLASPLTGTGTNSTNTVKTIFTKNSFGSLAYNNDTNNVTNNDNDNNNNTIPLTALLLALTSNITSSLLPCVSIPTMSTQQKLQCPL